MNDQQRAAMQMALEAQEAWERDSIDAYYKLKALGPALREALRNASERIAQPQGESSMLEEIARLHDVIADLKRDVEFLEQKEAQPQGERVDLASAWAEGYEAGIDDERQSEANIGIAGFGVKISPDRQNPYTKNTPPVVPQPQGDEKQWLDAYKRGYDQGKFDLSMESQPQGERTDVMLCCPNCNTAVPSGVSIKSAYLFGGTAQEFALWLQDGREPEEQHLVAWMWQHDETGRIGFVDVWQVENNWQENNPRNRLIKPLYSPEAIEAAIEATKEKAIAALQGVATGRLDVVEAIRGME